MIHLICFDLDGVLVDTKELHFQALNLALKKFGQKEISLEDHLNKFDGLSTIQKLKLLNVSSDIIYSINNEKQKITEELIDQFEFKNKKEVKNLIEGLPTYQVAIVSNATEKTVKSILKKLDIRLNLVDCIPCAQKPESVGYLSAMVNAQVNPHETLIIEDSPIGLTAAHNSGAHVMQVKSPNDLTLESIYEKIEECEEKNQKRKSFIWQDKQMNLLIPMAGNGQRFVDVGYKRPKPLIEVNRNHNMIELVLDNLSVDCKTIFIVKPNVWHDDRFLDAVGKMRQYVIIHTIDKTTEGAACTTLIAEQDINNDNPLLIANCDQYINWGQDHSMANFLYQVNSRNVDGGILTFESNDPKWSYTKVDENGLVSEVKEKVVISNEATIGLYYYKKGSDYVKYAKRMIEKNDRHNGEFYVCPVFNHAIADGKKFITYKIPKEKMWGLGTPEDLELFQATFGDTV